MLQILFVSCLRSDDDWLRIDGENDQATTLLNRNFVFKLIKLFLWLQQAASELFSSWLNSLFVHNKLFALLPNKDRQCQFYF